MEPARFPLADMLGMTIDVSEPGRASAGVEVRSDMHNPHGVVHGGVVFTMIDTAMGAATLSVLDEGQLCASIDVNVRFLRPVSDGRLRADVRVVQRGRRIVQLDAEVSDHEGRLVATATSAFAVLAP